MRLPVGPALNSLELGSRHWQPYSQGPTTNFKQVDHARRPAAFSSLKLKVTRSPRNSWTSHGHLKSQVMVWQLRRHRRKGFKRRAAGCRFEPAGSKSVLVTGRRPWHGFRVHPNQKNTCPSAGDKHGSVLLILFRFRSPSLRKLPKTQEESGDFPKKDGCEG